MFLKAQYEADSGRKKRKVELDYIRQLKHHVSSADARIKANQQKLEHHSSLPHPNEAEINDVKGQISSLQVEMEKLGEEGKVEESQALMKLVAELEAKEEKLRNPPGMLRKDVRLSSFLPMLKNSKRSYDK